MTFRKKGKDYVANLEDGVVIKLVKPNTVADPWEFRIQWTDGVTTMGGPFGNMAQASASAEFHYARLQGDAR